MKDPSTSLQSHPAKPRTALLGGAAALLSALVLGACATEPPPPVGSAYAPMNRVAYACQNGEKLEVRFFPNQGVAVLVRDGRTQELQETRTASGVAYEGDGVTLRGKGKEMLVQTRGAAPLNCLAAN